MNNQTRLLHKKYGETLSDGVDVKIYTRNVSVAKSNMSAVIRAYIVLEDEIVCLCEKRVRGCGLDRGHELAYNLFLDAWPGYRYQDHLMQGWI